MIKKIIHIVLIPIVLSGCGTEVAEEKASQYKPVFLSLSPHMTQLEFNKKIEKENLVGNLKAGIFQFPISNDIINLKVLKRHKSIKLKGKYSKKMYFETKKKLDSCNAIVNYAIDIFREKYKELDSVFTPIKSENSTNISLRNGEYKKETISINGNSNLSIEDYGFKLDKYFFFKDSIKTVVVGYKIFKDNIKLSRVELIEEMEKLESDLKIYRRSKRYKKEEKEKRYNIFTEKIEETTFDERIMLLRLQSYDKGIGTYKSDNTPKYYGFFFEIDYFHNKDFKSLQNKMINDSKEYLKSLENKKNEEEEKEIEDERKEANSLDNL